MQSPPGRVTPPGGPDDYAAFVLDAFGAAAYELNLATGALRPSPRLNALYGYPADHPLTLDECRARYYPADRAAVEAIVAEAVASGNPRFQREFRIVLPDGAVRWLLSRGEVLFDAAGQPALVRGAAIDITERKQAEASIAAELAATQLLRDLGAQLVADGNEQTLYQAILRAAITLTGADAGTVQILDPATHDLLLLATEGFDQAMTTHFAHVSARSNTPCGVALATNRRAFVDFDAPPDADPDGALRMHRDAGYLSAQSTPLIARSGRPIGMLSTHWRAHYRPGERELRFLDLLARQAADLIEQRQAEEALRHAAELDAFRVALNDALRPLVDPIEIPAAACRLLGEHLGVNRVVYAGIEGDRFILRPGYVNGAAPFAGRGPVAAFGAAFTEAYRRGESIAVDDVRADQRFTDAEKAALLAADIAAFAGVMLMKEGQWVGAFGAHHATPRQWKAAELALIQEVAERIWDSVERARVEAALRASEERQTFLLQLNDRLNLLTDPEEVQYQAACALGAYLGASRVGYAEDQGDGETIVVTRNYIDGVSGIEGRYRYDDYGPGLLREFRAGRTVVRPDIANDPTLTDAEKAAHAVLQLGTTINVPLLKAGRLVAVLFMHYRTARSWSDDELALLEAVAARTWDSVERARIEAALRVSEERYRTLLDSIDQGFCLFEMLYDSDGTPIDYCFLKVNPTFERHTGLRDPVGKTARELVPNLESHWFEIYGRVAATGEPLRFEQGSAAMGRWFEVEAVRVGDAERRQVALIFTDVTARRQADVDTRFLSEVSEQIRVSEDADQLLSAIAQLLGQHLQAARCFFSEIDDQGDRWRVRHEYRLPATLPAFSDQRPLSAFSPPVLDALRAGRTVSNSDTALDERTAPLYAEVYQPLGIRAFVAVPLRRNSRWVADLVVSVDAPRPWTAREISLVETVAERTWNAIEKLRFAAAQQAYAERLQQLYAQEHAARAQAEEASRIKDDFLATVSHELRTPLTAFLGYAELLQRRKRDETYIAQTVEKMVKSAKAQAALIEDLLDVSRIVSGKLRMKLEPIELTDVIRAALDTVRPTVEAKRLRLQTDLDQAGSLVRGDGRRLQQVVWNLLSNATKFTPPGGSITVRLALVGSSAELTVSDSGQGIHADFLPYVFERFRQADSSSHRAYGGLGLGLAIVRHLVELHGGTVAATSDGAGQGAIFTVRLPLVRVDDVAEQAGAPTGNGVASAAGSLSLHGLRVLVVDDQPTLLDLLEEMLASDGAAVRVCTTAREALSLMRAWQPDILVSDIAMPGEDGYWLIEQVRRLAPEEGGAIPAVALTAYVRMEDRLQVLAAGYQQYAPKPVDAAELRGMLVSLAAQRR